MSEDQKPSWKERLLIIPPILIGIAVVAVMVRGKQAPQQAEIQETARKARIISVPKVDVVPTTRGFGNVSPGKVWEGVSEVAGTVIDIHPLLKVGAIMPKDTVLMRIDQTDYDLAVRRIEADIRAAQAQLAELATRRKNTQASLDIEKRSLTLSEREFVRKKELNRLSIRKKETYCRAGKVFKTCKTASTCYRPNTTGWLPKWRRWKPGWRMPNGI
jgi:multidrug efflux system membrane fusion protein